MFPLSRMNLLYRVMIWPCTFHQDWWWSIWSQLTFFRSESAVVSICNVILFLPSYQVPCMVIVAYQMNLFCLFLFLCKFLVKVPNFWMWYLLLPRETFKCRMFLQGNLSTHDETHGDPILDLLVWTKSLSVEKILPRAQLSLWTANAWPG